MPLASDLSLIPSSAGEVFISTNDAIDRKIIPTTVLASSHPFREFWTNHLAALCRPGLYDTVIDALVALTRHDPSWRSRRNIDADAIVAKRSEMRTLFCNHPPNVVVVSGMGDESCGFHLREPLLWPFIYISEFYVDLWKDADRISEQGLALSVFIAAAIDHEIGHWVFTLKAGFLSESQLQVTPDKLKEIIKSKDTPKKLGAGWKSDSGEAGEYVETHSRGGIVEYSRDDHKVFIITGEKDEDNHILPLSYLLSGLEGSTEMWPSLRFRPPASGPGLKPGSSTKMKNSFFPRIADNCVQPSSSQAGSVGRAARRSHCETRRRADIFVRDLIQKYRSEHRDDT